MTFTQAAFHASFERTVGHEGRFSNDPNDNGNWTGGKKGKGELKGTKYGISANFYYNSHWLETCYRTEIEDLSLNQAQIIYFNDFWSPLGVVTDQSSAFYYQYFDAAVNHGVAGAHRILQRAVGVDDDGVIGPATLGAVDENAIDELPFMFISERMVTHGNSSTWSHHGRGWNNRNAQNLLYATVDVRPLHD